MSEERRLRVAAHRDRIAEVCDCVVEAAEAAGLGERAVYDCQVAVDEAMTNIVEHGYGGGDDEGLIDVRCATEGDHFVITLIDSGPAFNPLRQTSRDPEVPLGARTPGGWGVHLMKKMMDEVSYTYREGHNHLVMVKVAPSARPSGRDEAEMVRREVAPGVWVISPAGRLDSISSQPLEEALKAELKAGHTRLIVDMGRVSYISSSGLKALVSAWRQAESLHGEVMVIGMRPRVQEVFEIVGLDQVLRTFPTVERAVEALGAGQLAQGYSP
jgi:anti-anti-sigma factor